MTGTTGTIGSSGEDSGRVSIGKGLLTMTMDIAGKITRDDFNAALSEIVEVAKKQLAASFLDE